MDRLLNLEIFVRVAESRSFTRAADQLELPRSTVSAAVKQLEARLGTPLLNRTTRRVNLTHDGSTYYERALRLLADFDEAETMFRRAGSPPAGKVRADLPGRVARLILAPALPDFHRQHPEIELELGVTDRPIDLVEEGVDCAIRVGELAESGLVARRLGELNQINCASPDYLARHGTPERLADLQEHLAVHYASPLSGRVEDWEFIDQGRSIAIRLRSVVTVNNAEAYIACCLAGLGMIQVPAYDVQTEIRDGLLTEVLPQHRPERLPISVLYPHRRHRAAQVEAFVAWASALFAARMGLE
ncbi:LysR family transcriptional regulator [Algiphilus aromaticivorans]|uniref:LysR family transcriptional regulator n=1 Tax=Algiphilus aromaticivorans TaxID=382454 RepID=UPI0005C1EAEA|nr:LysR family transcriptional regulator [Algiphilus aromaticivorans]